MRGFCVPGDGDLTAKKDILMGPVLEALYELQKVEIEMARLRRRVKLRQKTAVSHEKSVEECQGKIDELNSTRIELQKKYDLYELDQKEREEKIQKSRSDLNRAKTNKEYSTILTQINTYKADMAKLDEVGIELLSRIESINEEIVAAKEEKAGEQGKLEAEKGDSDAQIERIEEELSRLQEKWDEAAARVDPDVLSRFEILAANYEGEAMAEVDCSGPGYSCGGCFMSVNSEHVNALTTKDEIRFCDSCGRILYLKDAPPAD